MPILNKISNYIQNSTHDNIHYKKWNVDFRDALFKDFYWSYFPITEKYFFEGNPAFFYEFRDNFDLGRYSIVTIRDGFAGVLDFFLQHPKPPYDLKTVLLINHRFINIVPPSWKHQVAFYQVKGTAKDDIGKEVLYFHGLATEEYFWNKNSPMEYALELRNIASSYNKTVFILPQRESILSTWQHRKKRYDIEFYKVLYEVFGFDIQVEMNSSEFFELFKKPDSFSFYNLDQVNGVVADNYIDHFFYSLGGDCINEVPESVKEESSLSYKLSRFHKIEIFTSEKIGESFLKYYLPYKGSAQGSSLYNVYKSDGFKEVYIQEINKAKTL